MRITLAEALAVVGDLPQANIGPADPRARKIVNDAVQQICVRSQSLYRRVRICVDNFCITLPREFASVSDVAICRTPIPVRNQWFEFDPDGNGVFIQDANTAPPDLSLHSRGEVCTFREIQGANKKVKLYCDKVEALGSYLWIWGLDQNGLPVRTMVDGVLTDGIRVDLSTVGPGGLVVDPILSSWNVTKKAVTLGAVRAYEFDTVTSVEIPLALYTHEETMPAYQRYLLRGNSCTGCCDGKTTVTAMAKLEYFPATYDDQVLLVPWMPALKLMMLSNIKMYEANQSSEAVALAEQAMKQMTIYRNHYQPKKTTPIKFHVFGSARLWKKRVGSLR